MNENNELFGCGVNSNYENPLVSRESQINDESQVNNESQMNDECLSSERPVEASPDSKYPITIHHLSYGYNVKIGCQNFAVETVEKLIKNLEAYLKDPSGTERLWMRERKLI